MNSERIKKELKGRQESRTLKTHLTSICNNHAS